MTLQVSQNTRAKVSVSPTSKAFRGGRLSLRSQLTLIEKMKHHSQAAHIAAAFLAVFSVQGAFAADSSSGSSVTLYGVVDTNVRVSTHENASGGSKTQMDAGGPITGSRWGLRMKEDLGGGLSAFSILESGFDTGTGQLLQGGRAFGRQSLIGLQGAWGQVTAGRQYTVAHEMAASYEALGIANNSLLGFQSGYTNLRQDNLLRYAGNFGPVSLIAGWTFGEQAGSGQKGATKALAAAYKNGPLRIGGTLQRSNNVSTYLGTAVAESREDFYSLGGTYDIQKTKLFFSFNRHRLDNAGYANNAVTVGMNMPVSERVTLIGTAMVDRMQHAQGSGKRMVAGGVLEYALSRSATLYGVIDYTRMSGEWMSVATQPGFSTPFYGNDNTRLGLGLGARVRF